MLKKIISACLCVMSLILYHARVSAQGVDVNPPAGETISAEEPSVDKAKADEKKSADERVKKSAKRIKSSDQLIITATKTNILKRETGASVTVITAEDIERSGETRVAGVLEKTPSITVIRNGQYGGITFLSIRGSHQKNVLVMIDGVRMNDVSQIDRDFDFGSISADSIERIEIIRGGAGVIYGSEASGGVINIISKKGGEEGRIEVKAGAGSHFTFRESAIVSGAEGRGDYSFFIAREDSRGISKADSKSGEKMEKDMYSSLSYGSRLGYKFNEKIKMDFSMRYLSSDSGIDDGVHADDTDRAYKRELMSVNLILEHSYNDLWTQRLSVSRGATLRQDTDPEGKTFFNDSIFKGNTDQAEWINIFNFRNIDILTAGVSTMTETASSVYASNSSYGPYASNMESRSFYSNAAFVHNHLKLRDRFFLTAGGRFDYHEFYGGDMNQSYSASIVIPETGTRIRMNFSTGFKSPSLYQLYDPSYGNKDLEPEKNMTFDAGIEQGFADDFIVIGLSHFRSQYGNIIGWVSTGLYTGTYMNISENATAEGVEAELIINEGGELSATSNYTYSKTYDSQTGKGLPRRPRHQAGGNVNWNHDDKANINLSYIYRGKRKDSFYDDSLSALRDVDMNSYYRIDLAGSYNFYENYTAFARIQNITNNKYNELYGYKSDGINIFAGLKAIF